MLTLVWQGLPHRASPREYLTLSDSEHLVSFTSPPFVARLPLVLISLGILVFLPLHRIQTLRPVPGAQCGPSSLWDEGVPSTQAGLVLKPWS